jgi:hypothetical protein
MMGFKKANKFYVCLISFLENKSMIFPSHKISVGKNYLSK